MATVAGQAFTSRGYEIVKEIRVSDDRYCIYELERSGHRYFGKQVAPSATQDQRVKLLTRQRRQVSFYERLNGTKCGIRAPWVHDHDPGGAFYIAELFQQPFYPDLGDELTNLQHLSAERLEPDLPKIVDTLVALDRTFMRLRPDGKRPMALNEGVDSWEWLRAAQAAGGITANELAGAKELIERYQPHVVACMQHTDFQPLHLYHLPNGWTGIIDAENSNHCNPRFLDLAEMYCRLFTLPKLRRQTAELVRQFLEKGRHLDEHAFRRKFLPVMTYRALGMIADAQCHSVREVAEYRAEALELLERCRSERLETFLIP